MLDHNHENILLFNPITNNKKRTISINKTTKNISSKIRSIHLSPNNETITIIDENYKVLLHHIYYQNTKKKNKLLDINITPNDLRPGFWQSTSKDEIDTENHLNQVITELLVNYNSAGEE